MSSRRSKPDPHEMKAAVDGIAKWLYDADAAATPSRNELAKAVRLTARTLEHDAPGHSVELRVPPFVAVQCIEGPRHTRGTPDRKSTRLNSSHVAISYAVFCVKKKKSRNLDDRQEQ